MPPVVVSLINLKGGVGKTTTTVQLAECLVAEYGKRVLVIDLDPQTNSTIALIDEESWEELDESGRTVYQLFADRIEKTSRFNIRTAIQPGVSNLKLRGLSLLPSSIRLIDIQDRMAEIPAKAGYSITPMEVIKAAVQPVLEAYDYVLIDCPPNLGFITRNGIEISDYYLIPTIPDRLSCYGIPQILNNIEQFKKDRGLKVRCLGVVYTKFSSISQSHKRGMATLPPRLSRVASDLGIPAPPIFETVMPLANATADSMDFNIVPKTFREKYGRSKSGDRYLYQYVSDLTEEFKAHAEG